MITYRNLILQNVAMTFNSISDLPIIITNSNIDRNEHKFFGVNLTPEYSIMDFVFENNGIIIIDYIHDGIINKETESISADEIIISTKINGLSPEKELEYFLRFGQKEEVYFT